MQVIRIFDDLENLVSLSGKTTEEYTNNKEEYDEAYALSVTWIEANTSARDLFDPLTGDWLADLVDTDEQYYLKRATASLTEIYLLNDDVGSGGGINVSIDNFSTSAQANTIVLNDTIVSFFKKAGVITDAIGMQVDFERGSEFEDVARTEIGLEPVTRDDADLLYVKRTIAGSTFTISGQNGVDYNLSSIADTFNSRDVSHTKQDTTETNVGQELVDVRDLTEVNATGIQAVVDKFGDLYSSEIKHTRKNGEQTTSQTEHWVHRDRLDDTQEKLGSLEAFVTGSDAQARVSSSVDQELPDRFNLPIEFDTIEVGSEYHPINNPTGNVNLDNNTITVSNYTGVEIIKYIWNLHLYGDNNGAKTISFQIQHRDANNNFKGVYFHNQTFAWDTEERDILVGMLVDLENNLIITPGKRVIEPNVAITEGDTFLLYASSESASNSPVHLKLWTFALEDRTGASEVPTASQITYDDTDTELGAFSVQEAIERLNYKDIGLDMTSSGPDVTDLTIFRGIYDDSREVDNIPGLTVIFHMGDALFQGVTVSNDGFNSVILDGFLYETGQHPQFGRIVLDGATVPPTFTPSNIRVDAPVGQNDVTNKEYVDNAIANATPTLPTIVATDVEFDNTTTTTESDNVQGAIEELYHKTDYVLDVSSLGDVVLQEQLFQLCIDQGFTDTDSARGVNITLPFIGTLNLGDPTVVYNGTLKLVIEGVQDTPFGNQYIAKGFTEDISNPQASVLLAWTDQASVIQPALDRLSVREPALDNEVANKVYVDNAVANAGGGGGSVQTLITSDALTVINAFYDPNTIRIVTPNGGAGGLSLVTGARNNSATNRSVTIAPANNSFLATLVAVGGTTFNEEFTIYYLG